MERTVSFNIEIALGPVTDLLVNRDDFISRWKTTNFPQEEVIASNMQLRD